MLDIVPVAVACPVWLQGLAKLFLAEEVSSMLKHELRNKVSAIRNATFYIRRKAESATTLVRDDPRVGNFFQVIDDEVVHCSELLVSRLQPPDHREHGGSEVEVVAATAMLLESMAPPPSVKLEGVNTPPVWVRGSCGELQLALFCLVENAVEAIQRRGQGALRVSCARSGDGLVTVAVVDDGPGLEIPAPEALKPFSTTKPHGLGLGLNIAKRIAIRNGGKIQLGPRAWRKGR